MSRPATERRAAPRYPVDTGIFASIDGHTVRLSNISLSGAAIRASGLIAGRTHLLELNLNRQHVTLRVEVLDCNDEELLHVRFVEPGTEEKSRIHAYIAEITRATGTS